MTRFFNNSFVNTACDNKRPKHKTGIIIFKRPGLCKAIMCQMYLFAKPWHRHIVVSLLVAKNIMFYIYFDMKLGIPRGNVYMDLTRNCTIYIRSCTQSKNSVCGKR